MTKIYVGMSGWQHAGWRGGFYPKGLVQKRELEYASRQVTSIEVNGTFYSLQKPETFQKWHDSVPDDFVFAVKAPQYITHVRRLKEVEEPLATFFASGVLCLREKLGPFLWQFPPNVMLKDDRFEKFMRMLPRDSHELGRMAKNHGPRVKGRNYLEVHGDYPIRHAFEFRHPSFFNSEFLDLMREQEIAVVIAHSGLKSPYTEQLTGDFVYCRMHGQESRYVKGYPPSFVNAWSEKVRGWSEKRDVFVYFDTEEKDYAADDALNLLAKLNPSAAKAAKKSKKNAG